MRKFLAVCLALALLTCAGALAEHGEADIVSCNGVPQHLTLVEITFANSPFSASDSGELPLRLTIIGFTDGLLAGDFGEKQAAELHAVYGDEEINADSVIDRDDEAGTGLFYIPGTTLPDALMLYPYDGSGPVMLWEAGDPVPELQGETTGEQGNE